MKRLHWMVLTLVMVVVAGCAGSKPADEAPAADRFPVDRFLTAEAAGATEGEAKRAAMAELASIFESRVYALTVQQATSWMGEGLPEQFDKQVEQTVRIQTEVQLQGARIGSVRQDDAGGVFRALAVLDRRQAASRWQRELAEIQMTIDGQVEALEGVKGRLSRLAALNRITARMVRQAAIESRLSVLGRPAAPGLDDRADLIAQREQLAREVSLFIQLDGNPAPPFARRLNALLAGAGYPITPYRDEAAGLITGTIRVQPLDLGNPEVRFIRAMADVQLVDRDTDTQIAAFDESVRKGHVDESEAARRSVEEVAAQVSRKLVRALGTLGEAAD
ncbi:MAG: LPP20 family lipoprotein [Deltaproteobacteria bacterium]|nr:LPP20 family lipoprotein [Deltaproteobacteria bacterium]